MFCSDFCQESAHYLYHKYECAINSKINNVQELVHQMRSFFHALFFFDGDIQYLQDFMESRGNVKKTVFDYDMSEWSQRTAQHSMLIFDSFEAPAVSQISFVISSVFEAHPLLAEMWSTHKAFIMSFLIRHSDIQRFIAEDLHKWPSNGGQHMTRHRKNKAVKVMRYQKQVGKGYYLFCPLITRSLTPNVHRHLNEYNKLCLIVSRDIQIGENLTVGLKYVSSLHHQ